MLLATVIFGFFLGRGWYVGLQSAYSDRFYVRLPTALFIVAKRCMAGLWSAEKSNTKMGSTFRLVQFSAHPTRPNCCQIWKEAYFESKFTTKWWQMEQNFVLTIVWKSYVGFWFTKLSTRQVSHNSISHNSVTPVTQAMDWQAVHTTVTTASKLSLDSHYVWTHENLTASSAA